MSVTFRNYSMKTGTRHDMAWYEWCIFSPDSADVLENVREVEYQLHPSFADPIRRIDDLEHRFALFSSGWGEFTVRVKVAYKNGTMESTNLWLTLKDEAWPLSPPPTSFRNPDEARVYGVLTEGEYRWRKMSTIVSRTGLTASTVKDTLEVFQGLRLARRLPNPSIDGQILWGATSIVGCTPEL